MGETKDFGNLRAGAYRAGDEEHRDRAEQALERAKATEARLRSEGRLMNVEHGGRRWMVSRADYFERRTCTPAGWNPQTGKPKKK